MDREIEEELNWFAEDPVLTPLPSPPPSLLKRSLGLRTKSSRHEGGKSRLRDAENEDVSGESKKSRRDGSPADVRLARHDDGSFESRKLRSEDVFTDNRKLKSDEGTSAKQFDLLGKAAKTAVEKLSILDERDKLLRINLEENKSSTRRQSTKGVCPDMCPEKERILRDVRGIVAVHEAFPDTNIMDHSRAVKEYARSSADQDEPLSHELRPIPVLRMTMDYLITEIICKLDNNDGENKGNWYDFCWGRLRAIRKDIIQQQFCDINTVTIVEECARFHICCFDRLWGSPKSVFDDKINSETLMNCLQSLMYMYEDLRKQGKSCQNEAEFRAYMVLLKLHSGFVLSEFQQFPVELQKSARVREAVDIHTAYSNNMYSTYFMLLKKTTYLNACLMQRFFGHLRTRALEIIIKSHCPPNKTIKISVAYLAQTLKFDRADDCVTFCIDFGLLLSSDGSSFSVSRNDFYLPETMFTESKSSSLVVNKRIPVARTVLSNKDIPKMVKHKVHSSFTEDHFLKAGALDASDQEEKMLRDNVARSIAKNESVDDEGIEEEASPEEPSEVLVSPITHTLEEEHIDIPDVDMSPDMPFDDDDEIEDESERSSEVPVTNEESPELEDQQTQSSGRTSPTLAETDESDSDSYSTTDIESISASEPASPLKLVTTPPSSTTRTAFDQQKPSEQKKPMFSFPTNQPDIFSKMSEPFRILSTKTTVISPEKSTEQKSFFKKPKTDAARPTQKSKVENENNVLMAKLRKKLSEKMKHVTAKKYARIWRKKVEKIKEDRKNEGLSLRHITVEEYMKLWGSTQSKYRGKTSDRLLKRKKANILVTALLHLNIIDQLDIRVKAVGDRIAAILGQGSVKWADRYGNISQPQPVFWKLMISLPERIEDSAVFVSKLRLWCKTAFHSAISPKANDVCFWKTKSGVPVFIHPIITEGIDEIEKSGKNFSAVVLVRAEGWETTQHTEKRLKTLSSMTNSSASLAVLTLGTEMSQLQIDKLDREKFVSISQAYWKETNDFVSALVSLAKANHMDNLKVQPLGFLIEVAIEKLLDSLHQDQYLNEELSDSLTNPNYIIKLHNILVDRLEEEVTRCCFYSYYGLACELEPLVRKLKCAHDVFPANYQNLVAFKQALHSHMKGLKLSTFKWEFADSVGFLAELRVYCDTMGCPHLLSKLVRTINPPDPDSGEDLVLYLKDIPWLPIVEMLAKQRISKDAYTFKVVYSEEKIRELTLSHWWLKL